MGIVASNKKVLEIKETYRQWQGCSFLDSVFAALTQWAVNQERAVFCCQVKTLGLTNQMGCQKRNGYLVMARYGEALPRTCGGRPLHNIG
jgi:hypothetical protein